LERFTQIDSNFIEITLYLQLEENIVAAIAIIGTGYVGLTTGACFAHLGHKVICADIDIQKIKRLQNGEIPIVENGLERIVDEGIRTGNLRFVVGAAEASKHSEFHYLCVPTPQSQDGSADLTYLQKAAEEIRECIPENSVVVNKSTVPVGSTKVVADVLKRPDVAVVSNPEFLREGSAVDDFLNPDRVVIGSDDEDASIRVATLYAKIPTPILLTNPLSAEMIKYASNAFLASKLSFINAISNLCEAVGADVNDVVRGMGSDTRIGLDFFSPGPGWGGSCFPKDTVALRKIAEKAGYQFKLLDEVLNINTDQFDRVSNKIIESLNGASNHVAVFGLTFKAGTDDLRDSPSIEVIRRLEAAGVSVKAYDPAASKTQLQKMYPDLKVQVVSDPYTAAKDASVISILTEWEEFAILDFDKLIEVMHGDTIIDTRGVVDPNLVKRRGFNYRGIAS